MPTICVCSSASFYKQVVEAESELEVMGYKVVIPATAHKMKAANDYDVEHHKTWLGNAADYHKKTALMRAHFNEVAAADVVLVLNYEKHGVPNYVGGNVLMEMAIAFHIKKPIFILNDPPEDSNFIEEIRGMEAVSLAGDLTTIKKYL